MWDVVIAVLITLVIAVPVSALAAINYRKKVVEAKIGNADEKAREIIDEALKTAETKKRESLLEVKEESIRTKNELDKEMEARGLEFVRYADDCIIMVGSEMAANRVMKNISRFIEEKLGLKVNATKSKVDRPEGIKLQINLPLFHLMQTAVWSWKIR